MPDIQSIIDRIVNDERMRRSSHFSERIYTDEPILTTGRQMANYLPDRYREMRAISRWLPGENGGQGRWLTEAELFWRQGTFMADFEDDCPYHGTFKAFYPTYNAMSDRQLRGYFTWRAAVRRGRVEETSLSFAYVYLYELLCGIGVDSPREGFGLIKGFWEAYRTYAPEIDRYARVWLQDYAVYHGLDPQLLADQKALAHDRMLMELKTAQDTALAHAAPAQPAGRKRSSNTGALLPPDSDVEQRLLAAIDALSTYRISTSRYYRDDPDGLTHVACAVYVHLCRYYGKHRKLGLIESLFGSSARLPYTMFASAVFYDPARHADCIYDLDEICHFTCEGGLWTCERVHGSRSRSPKLGEAMRAVDRKMRAAAGYEHPLKEEKIPRYLDTMIDREIEAWRAWSAAHAPRVIDIDLSKLSGIRSAAAQTREALLVDEEREEAPDIVEESLATDVAVAFPQETKAERQEPDAVSALTDTMKASVVNRAVVTSGSGNAAPAAGPPNAPSDGPLDERQAVYLAALMARDAGARAQATAGTSEDMLVDSINEALFDVVGDTVIEFGDAGPQVVEDYRDDIEELLK